MCKLTINTRGKKYWGVWPRICCTITQQITFAASYGSGQKKMLGKVTLWMCQKRQLPLAIFNCRNLIRKDGCTQLVLLPLPLLCSSDISKCYTPLQLILSCMHALEAQYLLQAESEPHTRWTSSWRRPCAGFIIKTREEEQIKKRDAACSTAMILIYVANHS